VAGALTGGLIIRNSEFAKAGQRSSETNHISSVQGTNGVREWRLPAPMMGPLRKDFVDKLQKELKINAVQKEKIEKIISEGQEQTKNIWLEIEPDIHDTMVLTKDRILAELTPEQRTKFEEIFRPKPKPTPAPTNAVPVIATNTPIATNVPPAK
jgi:Spy/CpxP family protein refolding chaperone